MMPVNQEDHAQRFPMTAPEWTERDPEWRSALHVLAAPVLWGKDVHQWINFERRVIEFDALTRAAAGWSSGERLMIRAAHDLFNGGGEVKLADLIRTLDDSNMRRVLLAIEMRCGF